MLAIGIGVAGASLLLALRRGQGRTTPTSTPTPLVIPPPPARLPADSEFARTTAPAASDRASPATTTLLVRVQALPAARRTKAMGVATFDATTGAGFVWTPLAEATEAEGVLSVQTAAHSTGELCITLATERAFARRGYLALTRCRPRDAAADGTAVVLNATAAEVRFELPPTASRAGPMLVVRLDDPQWLPMDHGPTGLSLERDQAVAMWLGAGAYELRDPIAPERRQQFTVPSTGSVVIAAALAVVRADRP